ncbi:polyprenyl synthetase [Planoprotostelium fungivorum]|uniref:Polyprenyl synthetase n=1 Tax=Planoprotostelium fungivorum TaxID=1890364 RepID=A0A2P6NMM7_9EUKA|nr:polyprenyl synthetase [Planoprotostelium fungivorum]
MPIRWYSSGAPANDMRSSLDVGNYYPKSVVPSRSTARSNKMTTREGDKGVNQELDTAASQQQQASKAQSESDNKVDIKELIQKTLEKWIPRSADEERLKSIMISQRYKFDLEGINKSIFEPIWELLDRGGKRWRSTLVLLVAEALGKKVEDVIDLCVITEIIHNGSLIIDDIEDSSDVRRGKPCLHHMVGLDIAVNVGNMMYFLPMKVLEEKKKTLSVDTLLQCYEVYSQEMINVHLGQGLDICWHSRKLGEDHEPTVEHYLHMCANKTGALARMSVKLSAIVCGGESLQVEALGKFAESLGVAFQIQDDLLNLMEGNSEGSLAAGKGGVGEDIHEGKRTLMVIHSFTHGTVDDARRLKDILSMKTYDQVLIREAIDIMERSGSMQYAKEKAQQVLKEAWAEVDDVLPQTKAKDRLKALAHYMIERSI